MLRAACRGDRLCDSLREKQKRRFALLALGPGATDGQRDTPDHPQIGPWGIRLKTADLRVNIEQQKTAEDAGDD